jgi:hypothetical protein
VHVVTAVRFRRRIARAYLDYNFPPAFHALLSSGAIVIMYNCHPTNWPTIVPNRTEHPEAQQGGYTRNRLFTHSVRNRKTGTRTYTNRKKSFRGTANALSTP